MTAKEKDKSLKKETKKETKKEVKKEKKVYSKPINTANKNSREVIKKNIDNIIRLRREGNTIEYIARSLGICKATFYNHLNADEELVEALARGQYEYNAELKKSAMQRAVGYKMELQKTKKEYKIADGEKILIREVVDVEEKYVYSDLLAYKLLNLDKYKNVDEVPAELKELFEKYNRVVENED